MRRKYINTAMASTQSGYRIVPFVNTEAPRLLDSTIVARDVLNTIDFRNSSFITWRWPAFSPANQLAPSSSLPRNSSLIVDCANTPRSAEELIHVLVNSFPQVEHLRLKQLALALPPPLQVPSAIPYPTFKLKSLVLEDMSYSAQINMFYFLQYFEQIDELVVLCSDWFAGACPGPLFETDKANVEAFVNRELKSNYPKIQKVVMQRNPYDGLFYAMLKRDCVAGDLISLRLTITRHNEMPMLCDLLKAARRVADLALDFSPYDGGNLEEDMVKYLERAQQSSYWLRESLSSRFYLEKVSISIPAHGLRPGCPNPDRHTRLSKAGWSLLLTIIPMLSATVEELTVEWVVGCHCCCTSRAALHLDVYWKAQDVGGLCDVLYDALSCGKRLKVVRFGLCERTECRSWSTVSEDERVSLLKQVVGDERLAGYVEAGQICWAP
ncbi:hypothetical protein BC835DRAFT_331557 [Cytidiella melzeri]|nr:hypothetical protein BC835DRAFT_331557 [Cytidiella melzeri]